MEDKFLASMMRSTEVSLGEKFKLYKTHNDKLDPYGAKTPSETQLALIDEVKKYDFSQYGSAKEIIAFVKELCGCTYKLEKEILGVALPFMKFEELTLKEAVDEVNSWRSMLMGMVSNHVLQTYNWTKHKKEVLIKVAKESQFNDTFWKHLIDSKILTGDDLDILLFGQKVTVPEVRPYQMNLSGLSLTLEERLPRKTGGVYTYTLEKTIYASKIELAYKKKLLLWEQNRDTIGEAIKNIFCVNKETITEEEILEFAVKYGTCKAQGYQGNIYEMALNRLKKPGNLIKVARLLKTKDGWDKIIEKMELRKQDAKKILRIAKISGYSPIWEIFFRANDQVVPHEELMRIGTKSKDLALWAELLKHIDYSKISIDWVFKFVKVCGAEVVPHMQQMCNRKYKSTEACNCMEVLSKRFDWKATPYEKRIEALHLHWIYRWQDPIIDSLEKVEVKDFLSLNQKFKGVNEKLQSKVSVEV